MGLILLTSDFSLTPPTSKIDFQVTSSSVELHYRSKRPALAFYVEGALEAVAMGFFGGMDLHMELLRGRDDGTCDHEVRE